MARATGKPVQQAPTLPPDLRPLWWTFLSLHRRRTAGMGMNPIQFTEIEAWSRLNGIALEPWEVEVIGLLDDAYLESTSQ